MTVTTPATRNMITDYYDVIASAVRRCGAVPGDAPGTPGFAPGFDLPELTPAVREFYAAATVSWSPLGHYGGHDLTMLDLTANPGTRTTLRAGGPHP